MEETKTISQVVQTVIEDHVKHTVVPKLLACIKNKHPEISIDVESVLLDYINSEEGLDSLGSTNRNTEGRVVGHPHFLNDTNIKSTVQKVSQTKEPKFPCQFMTKRKGAAEKEQCGKMCKEKVGEMYMCATHKKQELKKMEKSKNHEEGLVGIDAEDTNRVRDVRVKRLEFIENENVGLEPNTNFIIEKIMGDDGRTVAKVHGCYDKDNDEYRRLNHEEMRKCELMEDWKVSSDSCIDIVNEKYQEFLESGEHAPRKTNNDNSAVSPIVKKK